MGIFPPLLSVMTEVSIKQSENEDSEVVPLPVDQSLRRKSKELLLSTILEKKIARHVHACKSSKIQAYLKNYMSFIN